MAAITRTISTTTAAAAMVAATTIATSVRTATALGITTAVRHGLLIESVED